MTRTLTLTLTLTPNQVWDTGLRSERLVLQKHAAPVTHVALQPGSGKRLLLSP